MTTFKKRTQKQKWRAGMTAITEGIPPVARRDAFNPYEHSEQYKLPALSTCDETTILCVWPYLANGFHPQWWFLIRLRVNLTEYTVKSEESAKFGPFDTKEEAIETANLMAPAVCNALRNRI